MKCRCIPASQVPHATPLYIAFLENFPRLSKFFHYPPTEEGVRESVKKVAPDDAIRQPVVRILREQNRQFGNGEEAGRNIERMAGGAVAVLTGQQAGLFGGPSYTMFKALMALRVAEELNAAGTPAVPVFWIAAEDHDLDEINHSYWLGREGMERLELPLPEEKGRPVGHIRLGPEVTKLVERAAQQIDGPEAEWVGSLLRECYRPEETFGTAFAKLFARLFAPAGLILVNPLDARLQRLAAPLFRRSVQEHREITQELQERGRQLERAGFHVQVKVPDDGTTVFMIQDGRRWPVRFRNGRFIANKEEFTVAEIVERIEREPETFSPSALLRPVMQDTLLPTAAYVGGPAEIAYFAQCSALYERMLGRMPAVLPRASFTVVSPKIGSLLRKYGLDVPDVWQGRQKLRRRMEEGILPASLESDFEKGEEVLTELLGKFRKPLEALDKTLLGTLETAQDKILFQFSNLRAKAGRAQDFRAGVLNEHERLLTDTLYPQHDLQERALCFLPFLARHGRELLAELQQQATLRCTNHQLVYLE